MGVWHFISMGESPGAVTSALAHIKQKFKENDIIFFGGDSNRNEVKKISGIIIFTTPEVWNGERPSGKKVCKDNRYGTNKGKDIQYGSNPSLLSASQVVQQFITDEFQEMLSKERGKVYWLEASYRDLDFNLKQLAKAFYVLSPPNETGREVWVNLTGGSNVMNLAAQLVTALSGITGRTYYTYTQDPTLLRPATPDEFWHDIPVIKVNFDRDYETILQVLATQNGWLDKDDLYSQVKQRRFQIPATQESFVPDYLNKLDGWLIERRGNQNRLLYPTGKQFLELIQNQVVRALVYKDPLPNPIEMRDIFKEIPLCSS